eukprot:scaffold21205_cov25-Tisochrysis_lutea.AAC.1
MRRKGVQQLKLQTLPGHYGDDEHDELVGGGRMDELDGQAHAGQQRKSAAPRHPRHQGHGRNSTAQELARQKSLT